MTPDVIAQLNRDGEPPEFHKTLLDYARSLVKMSRSKMSQKYTDWDTQDQIYRGERCLDKEDWEQVKKQKPVKMVVPNTFAQVHTFASFLFLLFTQNRTFFELGPRGNEDYGNKQRDLSSVLDRDCRANEYNRVLYQNLIDLGRFGPAITECCWVRKVTRAYITPEPTMINVTNVTVPIRPESQWQEFVKYEGNLIRPISPYKFFPDTRLPLTDFQRGEFCAVEEEYSKTDLYDMQAAGEVAGVEFIPDRTNDWLKQRGGDTRTEVRYVGGDPTTGRSQAGNNMVIVTKMQIRLVPDKFVFGPNDTKLGPETFPVLYHLWYANDQKIIRLEPAYWWHNEFGWTVSQFTPDMHETLNLGLANLIYPLQDVITWLINSRVTDVRRNLRGRNVVNPSIVEMKTFDGDGDIYIRKGVAASLLDKGVKQLDVQDVTRTHMADADLLAKLMEVVTGVNANAMGQYNSGRRSAQEARVVTAGSTGRMKMHGQLIWESGPGKLAQFMASNSRQSLSFESFQQIIGNDPDVPARYQAFKGSPAEIIGGNDYFIYDGTMSSEKGYIAQSLQELFVAIMSNPVAAVQFQIDPRKILEEIQWLRGAGSINRFRLDNNVRMGIEPPLTTVPPQVAA